MKKLIVYVFLSFCIVSCASKKSNNGFDSSISKSKEGKITYEIATRKNYLELDTLNSVLIKFENIDTKTVSIIGRTIRIVKFSKEPSDEVSIELSPGKDDVVNGTFKVIVNHKTNGIFKTVNLYIPVKMK